MLIRVELLGRHLTITTGRAGTTPNVQMGSNPPLRTQPGPIPIASRRTGFHMSPRADHE